MLEHKTPEHRTLEHRTLEHGNQVIEYWNIE